jgi:ATP-binding cassette subfamily B protein
MDGLYRKLYDLQYADQSAPRGDGARADQARTGVGTN